jgi:hypothetical protein
LFFFIVFIVIVGSAGFLAHNEKADENTDYVDVPLFRMFRESRPDKEVVALLEGDCNADGVSDLIVVYRENEDRNHQVTVYSKGTEFLLTDPIPAPFQDCRLEWRDVDERPPCELSVSGRRGARFGYSILRFEENEWKNVYGEAMADCC